MNRYSAVSILIVLFINLLCVESLKEGDEGVRVVTLSSYVTKREPYSTVVPCGNKRCVKKKWRVVRKSVTKRQLICMYGFQHSSELDKCVPICTGCQNGRCIAPENCACDAPLTLDPKLNDCVSSTTCDHQCVNSNCVNSECQCIENTRRYNASHCANCEEGYTINQDLTCTPYCEQPCINSFCSTPNGCSCELGYQPKDRFTCEPICDGCIHGECVAPQTCKCFPGYEIIEGKCWPVCHRCDNGTCVGPNDCECHEGYQFVNGSCEAICDPLCVNGVCIGPNQCVCEEGYESRLGGNNTCVRKCPEECRGYCDDDGNCEELVCVDGHLPNKTCCPGYLFNSDDMKCQPMCRTACTGGSVCSAPDSCACVPPLVWRQDACVSPCDEPCVNGDCVGVNSCQCHTGFTKLNVTHCLPTCPTGYVNDPFDCKPVCETPCVNGICSEPDTCTCYRGYEKVNESNCVPHCDQECVNAFCGAPDECLCNEGYTKNKTNDQCTPICDTPCSNGSCSGPNNCTCDLGYESDPLNKFNCLPICEPKCENASCVSPNMCTCDPGYIRENNWSCKPYCGECENGHCVQPDLCKCDDGYERTRDKCMAVCKNGCVHGYCSSPGVCSCEEGYKLNSTNNNTCEPVCNQNCVNSDCVAPDICECKAGYRNESNTCKPICDDCKDGVCMSPGQCICLVGYKKSEGQCSPVCKKECINGYCSAPFSCKCHDGYNKSSSDPHICYKPCNESCDGYCDVNGVCHLEDMPNCNDCKGNCTEEGSCRCFDGKPCTLVQGSEKIGSSTRTAGLELTWIFGSAVALLLIVLILVVIQRIWSNKKHCGSKVLNTDNNYAGSVIYTAPNTLLKPMNSVDIPESFYEEVPTEEPLAEDRLLEAKSVVDGDLGDSHTLRSI